MTLMNQTGMICAGCGAQTGTVASVCPSCKDWAKHLVQLTAERDAARAECASASASYVDAFERWATELNQAIADRDRALALLRKAREPLAHWIHHDEGLFGLPRADDVALLAQIDALLSEKETP